MSENTSKPTCPVCGEPPCSAYTTIYNARGMRVAKQYDCPFHGYFRVENPSKQ